MAKKNPRILIVTPEITYLPTGMGNMAERMSAKAGGLADVSASLVAALYDLGADVHVALPHYRKKFQIEVEKLVERDLLTYKSRLKMDRIHLAEDSSFYRRDQVYSNFYLDSIKMAIAFQREVINNIIPQVRPDLIHCNDWMTGLIPAAARRIGIPSLFTVHNIHTQKIGTDMIVDRGIDVNEFWQYLYYDGMPGNYDHARQLRTDFLASGIFASHFINTVSPTFLEEVVRGWFDFIPGSVRQEIQGKYSAGCATGILNAPDASYDPANAKAVVLGSFDNGAPILKVKAQNKMHFQECVGLEADPTAPLFLWPSRLDPVQKGCQLLSDILYRFISAHWGEKVQFAVVANGPYQEVFSHITHFHNIESRVAVVDFHEDLSRLGFAAADFILMPSLFEPCGLPQMIAPMYGTMTVAHDTGGLHDTVWDLDVEKNQGNGFLFKTYDSGGLWWGMEQALNFLKYPAEVREAQLRRISNDARQRFNHNVTARNYIQLYEQMLHRHLVVGHHS